MNRNGLLGVWLQVRKKGRSVARLAPAAILLNELDHTISSIELDSAALEENTFEFGPSALHPRLHAGQRDTSFFGCFSLRESGKLSQLNRFTVSVWELAKKWTDAF